MFENCECCVTLQPPGTVFGACELSKGVLANASQDDDKLF